MNYSLFLHFGFNFVAWVVEVLIPCFHFLFLFSIKFLNNPIADQVNSDFPFGLIVGGNKIQLWLIAQIMLLYFGFNFSLYLFEHFDLVGRQETNRLSLIAVTGRSTNSMNIVGHCSWNIVIDDQVHIVDI